MKILLLGKNGQVGWELQRSLAPLGEVLALDRSSTTHCGDLSNLEGLAETVRVFRPQVVVNAAAYTAVDKAESDSSTAHLVNALAPEVLSRACAALDALLVHYSTDYVFDGSGQKPWLETDATGPLNVYGHSKLAGEQGIAKQGAKHVIFRTSWVYGTEGGNFAKTMLRLAQERDKMAVINDQFGAPTGAALLADITAMCLQQPQALSGIYHLAAAGETTWHAYAEYVLQTAKRLKPEMAYKVKEVAAVPTSEFPTPAQRPLNSRLNCSKLQNDLQCQLPDWQKGVDAMLSKIL
ncbi:dTDP-4-dehydrorhamnose reductase [Limnohabitans sp. Rim11]|uniref:dTDP-4-dehydrorhamnose reductase n=1 Tax=Limnohabitans sp. Rim11 TaxID=1100719 RepID=UPI000A9A206A|nr:dTDP-4-dehydrorhamnose reductase [Limnohabitans sp. Rim11]